MYTINIGKDYQLNKWGTKGDGEFIRIAKNILDNGAHESSIRPSYSDGTKAETYSIIGEMAQFGPDDSALTTLRPMPVRNAIGEIFWIYQDASNDLRLLRDKYNVHYWDNWSMKDGTIGTCYGYTVRKYGLMRRLLHGLKTDPFSRRHVLSLWDEESFRLDDYALLPCAFMTLWSVRPDKSLDMTLVLRSSDWPVAGNINMFQYQVLMHMVARDAGLSIGTFRVFLQNVHIYDRHLEATERLINRSSIECNPKIVINPDKTDFYSLTPDDIQIVGYPLEEIKKANPQMSVFKDEIAI